MSDDELRALERRAATGGEGDVLAWQIALLRTRGRLDTIHRELWLAAPPAEVRRLFESVALEDFRGEPVPGAELTLVRRPGAHESRVDLAFMDERGGTRVRVIESGFGTGPHWDWRYRDRDRQWDAALTKLFAAVELPGAASLVRGTELRLGHEEAWAAIATAPGLARWLCADAEVADDVGGPVRLRIDGDSLRGTVRERLPGRALAVALQPDSATEAPPTLLTFSLVPGTDRTGVVVVKTGQWRDGDVSSLDAAIRNLASVHGRHVDLSMHVGAFADDQRVVAPNLALEGSVDTDATFEVQLALELSARAKERRDVVGVHVAAAVALPGRSCKVSCDEAGDLLRKRERAGARGRSREPRVSVTGHVHGHGHVHGKARRSLAAAHLMPSIG